MKNKKTTNLNQNKRYHVGASRYATQNKQSHVGAGPVSAQNAITLISLVVTIIILLMLAGVTINLTLGNNGVFKTAQQAAKNYTDAQNKELADLNDFDNAVNDIIDGQNWSEPYTTTSKYNYTDPEGNKATIPAGFQVSLKEGERKVKEGLVIRNVQDKNEFVWVPVEGMGYTYDRYDFKQQFGTYEDYSETKPSDEETSVITYGGYYIGRYEAGIVSTTGRSTDDADAAKTAEEVEKISGKALSQAEKHVYNWLTRDQAKGLAEGVYTKASNNVTSKLCSSYAWDTALKFIETEYPEYPTNSVGGIYNAGTFKKTGQSISVKNIYDMGGNVGEWTTEFCRRIDYPCVFRGGYRTYDPTTGPASKRHYSKENETGSFAAFRISLYI